LLQDNIILNDYGACVEELSEGWFFESNIKSKDRYNDEELKEIHKMMFCDRENQHEYDSEEDYDFDQDIMEANDWSVNDTIYEILHGCELELVS
jgi:hypothetical protein